MTDDEGPREIDEGFQRGFVLDDRISFARLMLELSEYRCAVTGHTFSPAATLPHPDLEVYLFRKPTEGGELAFANALVVTSTVASLLDKGALYIDDHYRVVDRTTGIAGNRIHRHSDRSFWPTLEAIRFHRDRISL